MKPAFSTNQLQFRSPTNSDASNELEYVPRENNEKDISITFRTVLQAKWKEPRIIPFKLDVNENSNQVLNPSIMDYLWIMNLFIYNLKEVRKFKTLTPGDSSLGKIMSKTVRIVDL